jgi:cyclopropane fatty-acyl-phospholipid synthase-like methyltransferase
MEEWLKESEFDDLRRFRMLQPLMVNKKLLDFGCGAGGFLNLARKIAADVAGVELERRVAEHWAARLTIRAGLDQVEHNFDVVTAFHVLEHLDDPRDTLKKLGKRLVEGGRLVVEVPSADDALLTLYKNDDFQRFTYWSQHLYLFNAHTLNLLVQQAGMNVVALQQVQRYPLSNHLHWLSRGKPGGHKAWSFLDAPEVNAAYAASLATIGKCDTLVAYIE